MDSNAKCPTGKIRHDSLASACRHAISLIEANPENRKGLRAYKCRACGYWHLGHKKKNGGVSTLARAIRKQENKKR